MCMHIKKEKKTVFKYIKRALVTDVTGIHFDLYTLSLHQAAALSKLFNLNNGTERI